VRLLSQAPRPSAKARCTSVNEPNVSRSSYRSRKSMSTTIGSTSVTNPVVGRHRHSSFRRAGGPLRASTIS
jgi:hypothetical protein